MPSIVSCLCCERESAKFTGRTLSVLGRHADRAPFNEAASEFASTWLSNGTYHAFGEAMLRTSAARQMLPLSHAGVTISDWPSANSNGYAFYHRVDRVNGGDANATHTTGFGKSQKFWYK